MKYKRKNTNRTLTEKLALTALFAALSVVLYNFCEIPLGPVLKINPSDIPAVFAGVFVSWPAALFVVSLRCAVHLLRTTTSGLGEVIDFVIGVCSVSAFILPMHLIKKKHENSYVLTPQDKTKQYVVALVVATVFGVAATILSGLVMNILLYRSFMKLFAPNVVVTNAMLKAWLFADTLPMNAVRGAGNLGIAAFMLPAFRRFARK